MLSDLLSSTKVGGGRGCCLTCSQAQRLVGAGLLSDLLSSTKVGGSRDAV